MMFTKGPDPSDFEDDRVVAVTDEEFTFNGVDSFGYQEFLQQIRRTAFKEGKSRDAAWMADLAVLHLSGDALMWFETLPDDVQQDWNPLKRAIIQKYGGKDNELVIGDVPTLGGGGNNAAPQADPLLPARVRILNWGTPVLASTIHFPGSEREWLTEGQQRKQRFRYDQRKVYWHLVEPSESVPDNVISAGIETGVTFYTIRAWHEGSLTLGKLATQGLFWRSKRAWLIWHGREMPWSGSFEVLVGDQSAVRWIKPQSSGPFEAVEGGFEATETKALLVARFDLGGVIQPGKVFSGDSYGYYGWWLKESRHSGFEVLAWA